MAVPSIAYVTAGARLLATYMNSIKDYLDYLMNKPGCQAYRTTAGSIATATWSPAVGLDAEDFDRDGMHNPATNNSRIVFNTAGRYRVTARHSWDANATGFRSIQVRINSAGSDSGGTELARAMYPGSATIYTSGEVHTTGYFDVGDYVEYFVYQNSGTTLNYSPGIRRCSLEVIMEGTN